MNPLAARSVTRWDYGYLIRSPELNELVDMGKVYSGIVSGSLGNV
jgi:hypothetical protein